MDLSRQQLDELIRGLAGLRQGRMTVAQWSAQAQVAHELRAALPERFGSVLAELLNRLESSALFSEESCSFSQVELLDSLQLWLDKAGERLKA